MRSDQPGRSGSHPPPKGTLSPSRIPHPSPLPATPPPDSPPPFLHQSPPAGPGELGTLGGFRLLKELGRGGMGVVYEAEDPNLRRKVAIKCMLPDVAAKPNNRARFLKEARATAAVEHENIVAIFHVGEEHGLPFLVMPLLKGETLAARLRRDRRLPVGEVIRIAREMARGLLAAHLVGLIHRDVKPENVWLEAGTGRIKLLDFGIARLRDTQEVHTRTGDLLGTPGYMAPEQLSGGHDIDSRADLFSLGCVIYEMATGHQPFSGPNFLALLASLASHSPPPPEELDPDIPTALSQLIQGLIAKSPDRRPRTAADVLDALDRIAADPSGPLPVGLVPAQPARPPVNLPDPNSPTIDQPHVPVIPPEEVTHPHIPSVDSDEWADLPDPVNPANGWRPEPRRWRIPFWVWPAVMGAILVVVTGGWVARELLRPTPIADNGNTGGMTGGNSTGGTPGGTTGGTVVDPPQAPPAAEEKVVAGGGVSSLGRTADGGASVAAGKPGYGPAGPGADLFVRGLNAFLGRGQPVSRTDAAGLFKMADSLGHPAAPYWLAELHRHGYDTGVPLNNARAENLTRQAAERGYPPAQADLGWTDAVFPLPPPGNSPEFDQRKLSPLEQLAQDGDPAAMVALARFLLADDRRDERVAAEGWLRQAASARYPAADYVLARLNGPVPDVDRLRAAAAGGHVVAQWELGRDHAAGWAVPTDPREAFIWTARAADQGYPTAVTDLGEMYERQEGIPPDLTKDPTNPEAARRAAEQYRKADALRDPEGTYRLGRVLCLGLGANVDPVTGIAKLRAAADAGYPLAVVELGIRQSDGNGMARNPAEGRERVQSRLREVRWLAGVGDPTAMALLGELYTDGHGVEPDVEQGIAWYQKAADRGDPYGLHQLGSAYDRPNLVGKIRNPQPSFPLYTRAAEKGLPLGQLKVGLAYLADDKGKKPNLAAAERWLGAAAASESPEAQRALAALYKKDEAKRTEADKLLAAAVVGLNKAADAGDRGAQYYLGTMAQTGEGMDQDYEAAARWYEKAAAQDHPTAAYRLGWLHENGKLGPSNFPEAIKWYEQAAQRHEYRAATGLGRIYEMGGVGVTKDLKKARYWYQQAAEYDAAAKKALQDLDNK